jgi:Protein of unknown function DUF262
MSQLRDEEVQDAELEIEATEQPERDEVDQFKYTISYYPSDLTLKGYLDKHNSKTLRVPRFQRRYVWDQIRASKLIESFLLGLPVPGVFLYKERKTNHLLVIDGQQRIMSAIRFFLENFDDASFKLKNVQDRWDGKTYSELPESDRLQLDDSVLRATIIQQLEPDDDSSVYHIFERLNTGGVNLNQMEIRRCLYEGPFLELLEQLTSDPAWWKLLGQTELDKRSRDLELLLRVIALAERVEQYQKPMKTFLNNYMRDNRYMPADRIAAVRDSMEHLFKKVYAGLGAKPFHIRRRLNLAVMDSVMVAMADQLAPDGEESERRFARLIENETFLNAVSKSTSDEKVVTQRFAIARQFLVNGG